jgi:plastocyanin
MLDTHDLDPAPRRPNRARRLLPMLALTVLLVAAACGGDAEGLATKDDKPGTEQDGPAFDDRTGQPDVTIQVRDNSFVAQHVAVSAGTTVTFDNRGRNPHNAVPVEEGAFTEVPTESLQPGMAASVVFDVPGEYPYYCTLHGTESAGMVGTIRVVE